MHKLLAGVAGLALISGLAACGGEAPAPAPVETEAAAPTMETYVGAWNVTYPDGSRGVTTNHADGTFTRLLADGSEASGTWTLDGTRGCWRVGEAEPTCYEIGEEDVTGEITLTRDDGEVVRARRIVEGMTPFVMPAGTEGAAQATM